MPDAVLSGIPPEAAEAARATLGGALAVAAQLPDHLGAALRALPRSVHAGLQLTAVVSAVTVMVTAVVAMVLLRRGRHGSP